MKTIFLGAALCAAMATAACGGDSSSSCDPVAQSGCDNGQVCENVENGGTPACFAPLVIQGRVFDLASTDAIQGARVVALDPNSAPVSSVAVSGADGKYELQVPATRHADGSVISVNVTLRADAATFQSFPGGIREALPIETATATMQDSRLVLASALTDVGLIALPAGGGDASLHGHVDAPASGGGVLVVAESGGHGATAIPDRDGDYEIFNLAAGDYSVNAYALGSTWKTGQVTLAAAQDGSLDLALDSAATGSVDGTVQIVNGGGASSTSVLLVVESTFDEALERGAAPPGLRVGNVTSAYHLDGVPPGRYVVLGAFENDGLVRDPDTSIGGTSTLHFAVTSGQTTTVDGFKITGALAVVGPGADGPEMITGTPTLKWADDSSEDEYDVVVFDALGQMVWQKTLPGVSGGTPEAVYGGATLQSGMYYQFRVTSLKMGTPISATEDLKGVFFVP